MFTLNYDYKDKNTNTDTLNKYMLSKTLTMFEYEGLPETIPTRELEYILQTNGYGFITEVDGELYVFTGSLGGETDVYGRPTEITINNTYLNFNKTLKLDEGVLILNDDMAMGLLPLFNKHNSLLVENDMNMVMYGYNTRLMSLISASDDRTKASAELYMSKIVKGELSVIGENALFDGVKLQGANGSQIAQIKSMIEYHQYIKASLYNEIGLSANFNMKRERLTASEVEIGDESILPLVYNMMSCRLKALELLSERYNISVEIDFGSVWHYKDKKMVDGVIEEEPEPEVTDEANDEVNDEANDEVEYLDDDDALEMLKAEGVEVEEIEADRQLIEEMLTDESLSDDDRESLIEMLKEMDNDDTE